MNNNKRYLSVALVTALVAGLSGCYMDNENAQYVDYSQSTMPGDQMVPAQEPAKQKTYATKEEPSQKSTPGPKRAAAPALPVIQ